MTQEKTSSQVLILGTGIAGLFTAIRFAEKKDVEVTLVCKADRTEGSTKYAQGGIASVWSTQDSFEEHKRDTLFAGAGLCREEIVDLCVREGPSRIQSLIDLGVHFTKTSRPSTEAATAANEGFDLHREGGHGKKRILHADDLTGLEIERALLAKIADTPNIRVFEHHIGIDLITEGKVFKKWRRPGRCLGAYVMNIETGAIIAFEADITVLATGGAGKVYLYTTNPDVATGDGIAMAHRAGAQIANLEFMQFHPTVLFHPEARNFLISEAVRGEGGILKTIGGETFMDRYHPMKSLAPRDVVARAIDMEMKRTGDSHVLLDCTHLCSGSQSKADSLKKKFPNIYETCLKYGIDLTKEPIPVVPAAHYMCGGVRVDRDARTTIEGLYAVGEVTCTGLHGANRLASNSLLEAVVFAERAVENAYAALVSWKSRTPHQAMTPEQSLPQWDTGHAVEIEEQIDIAANWHEIRTLMWNYVGIVRSNRRLERAKRRLDLLKEEVNAYYWGFLLTKDLIELRNILTVADLMVQSALLRKESRGLHYTVNYPETDNEYFKRDTVI